jgi:hypothetical protein
VIAPDLLVFTTLLEAPGRMSGGTHAVLETRQIYETLY